VSVHEPYGRGGSPLNFNCTRLRASTYNSAGGGGGGRAGGGGGGGGEGWGGGLWG